MTQEHRPFGFERTTCACRSCSVFCRFMPSFLIPEDIPRMMATLNYTDAERFARENLLASPGAMAVRAGQIVRIPTLVPQRHPEDTACKFRSPEGLCTIHERAPYGCSHFDKHMSEEETLERKTAAFLEIERAWATKSLYAQLWLMLESEGKVAPSGQHLRQVMAEVLYREATARPEQAVN